MMVRLHHQLNKNIMIETLKEKEVVKIYQHNKNALAIIRCDKMYGILLNKENALKLADEIKEMALCLHN